jgi:hypothetical protein
VRIRAALVVGALAAAAAGCQQKPMTEYVSTECKFRGKFPGAPTVSTKSANGLSLKMFMVENWSGGYMIGVADMPIPPGEPAAKIQARLDDGQTGALKAVNGTLKESKPITLDGGHPGREFTGTAEGKHLRARFYLAGTRAYQLLVVGRSQSFTTSAEANDFFGAFQVLDAPGAGLGGPMASPGPASEAVVINSRNGRFRAKFPGDPTKGQQTVAGAKLTTYSAERPEGTCTVGYADLDIPADETEEKLAARLDAARDGAVQAIHGARTGGKKVTLNGDHPGWEFTATGDGQHLRGRVYLVDTRVYHVTVVGTEAFVTSRHADALFDTFQLTD